VIRKELEYFLFFSPQKEKMEYLRFGITPREPYYIVNRPAGNILLLSQEHFLPVFAWNVEDLQTRKKYLREKLPHPGKLKLALQNGTIHLAMLEKKHPEECYIRMDGLIVSLDGRTQEWDIHKNRVNLETAGQCYLVDTGEDIAAILDRYGNSIRQADIYYPEWGISLKNILDPDGGMDRLLENISRFPYSKKLEKLIQIVRGGQDDEERKIMNAIRHSDPGFFDFLQNQIFREDILPFLSRSEVYTILSGVPDASLAEIHTKEPEIRDFYLRCVSRNRMERVGGGQASGKESRTVLWDVILEYYRSRYSSCHFTRMITDYGDTNQGNPAEILEIPFLQMDSGYFYVIGFFPNAMIVEIRHYCRKIQLYLEIHRFEFEEILFLDTHPGIYSIPIKKIPDTLYAAGISNGIPWEYSAFRSD